MSDKETMQDRELDSVSGGMDYTWNHWPCPECGRNYSRSKDYPYGWKYKTETHGCNTTAIYYKCPNCGYEWKV